MKLTTLRDQTSKAVYAPAAFEGDSLNLVFYSGKLTPEFLKRMQAAESEGDLEMLAGVIDEIVAEWDLQDDDGNQLPASFEVARTVPLEHLSGVMDAIVSAVQEGATAEGKASAAG